MVDRRTFLAGVGAAAGSIFCGQVGAAEPGRKRVAFLGTEVRTHSHAQHFLDRLNEGYTWNGGWQRPRVDVASVYIAQFPKQDLAKERIQRYKLKAVPSVAEALTLGTGRLAVDGVVIIGEHGDYPQNEKGQWLYPRYEWFKEVTKVFRDCGRAVPVFNDKHLSTTWAQCVEMVEESRALGFPFHAGSSLPVTRRIPDVEVPWGTPLVESVCVCYGKVDSYDFHGYETAQCMSERRAGGEVGIREVLGLTGEKLWTRLQSPDREITRKLILAALSRSHNLPVADGFPTAAISLDWLRQAVPDSIGFFVEHRDGFRTTNLLLPGKRDFNYAGMRKDTGEILSCQMYLPMPERGATTADFFNPLVRHIENMVLTGKAPYPVERTLLTSGMVIAGVDSLHQKQVPIATPEMAVKYQVAKESFHWRD